MVRPLPQTLDQWFREIEIAHKDARRTKPFALLTGQRLTNAKLFHLAPLVCMKFRGLDVKDEELRNRVVEGALTNYVANTGPDAPVQDLESKPMLAFALCYVAAHYVLDLLDEKQTEAILCYCEERLDTTIR